MVAVESFLEQDIPDERRREGEAMQIALLDMAAAEVSSDVEEPDSSPAVSGESESECRNEQRADQHLMFVHGITRISAKIISLISYCTIY